MSNSPLVEYTQISPFKNANRIDGKGVHHKIKKITPHHMAGVSTLESFGNIVTRPGRNMSATYAIDKNARVGLFCDEKDRPWTSSSGKNDYEAVTIEISNSSVGGDWPVSDQVFDKLVELCVDICERNDIPSLYFKEDASGTLTYHYQFAATACPGPYLKSKTQELCDRVNAKLTANRAMKEQPVVQEQIIAGAAAVVQPTIVPVAIEKGSVVSISSDATYYNGTAMPDWVKQTKWVVSQVTGDRAVLGRDVANESNIQSPVNVKYLHTDVVANTETSIDGVAVSPYTVSLAGSDGIFKTPNGTKTGTIGGNGGVFTVTAESVTNGIKWGKLKSGAGWVVVPAKPVTQQVVQTTVPKGVTYKVGDRVKVLNAVQYNGKKFVKYVNVYTILEIKGDRAVISSDGKNVTCAINTKNIRKV